MASSTFPTANTVSAQVASGGGLSGDGSSGNKLAISGFSGTSDTQILFNSSGSVAGSANLTWDGSTLAAGPTSILGEPEGSLYAFQDGTRIGASGSAIATMSSVVYDGAGPLSTAINSQYIIAYNAGVGTVAGLTGIYSDVENYGGGTAQEMRGFYSLLATDASTTDLETAFYSVIQNTNGGVITTHVGFYSGPLGGHATNPYSFWHDEDGVFRIRADNTYNSVYQATPALYNPQFTKYTPGAADYERIIMGQWSSNVAQIGTEKGGTGTLRKVQLIGAGLLTNATLIPTADPHVVGQVWNNSGVMTISAG